MENIKYHKKNIIRIRNTAHNRTQPNRRRRRKVKIQEKVYVIEDKKNVRIYLRAQSLARRKKYVEVEHSIRITKEQAAKKKKQEWTKYLQTEDMEAIKKKAKIENTA